MPVKYRAFYKGLFSPLLEWAYSDSVSEMKKGWEENLMHSMTCPLPHHCESSAVFLFLECFAFDVLVFAQSVISADRILRSQLKLLCYSELSESQIERGEKPVESQKVSWDTYV